MLIRSCIMCVHINLFILQIYHSNIPYYLFMILLHYLFFFIFFFIILCSTSFLFFFFNDTATTEIYTLSLHDALPISLIPVIAVPVSLIGTFAIFPLLGFSINTLSLFAFVLAIGLVVDDAIIVVEAVERHIEQGKSPREATVQAMKEVGGPVIAIALILSSVFLPVAFMGGIQGRLNNQFAMTIAISMLISAFNALTLSPALAALLLRPRKKSGGILGRFFGWFNRGFEKVMHGYLNWSHAILRKAVIGVVIIGAFTLADAFMGRTLPTSFLPEEDYGYAMLHVQLPAAASLER